MLATGERLGPYLIVAPLGAGGMGEVYRAEDTRLGRTVAIKVLSLGIRWREDMRQRFEREAKAISRLSHPHICTLFDVGRESDVDYLVMEYLEGETADKRLARGALPLADAFRYAIQIANALDCAHRSGTIHRDLKPGNIMLTKNGAKLLDFGLARLKSSCAGPSHQSETDTLTAEQTILGTLPYMSPEQVEGKQADIRSDIFSFGSLFFEMLTGQKAFPGEPQAQVMTAILTGNPLGREAVQRTLEPRIQHILRVCLAKDPENRWQSARDVALEIEFVSKAEQAPAPSRKIRLPTLWAGVGSVVVVALGILISYLLPHRENTASLVQLEINPPEHSEFSSFGSAISPDGRYIAFVAMANGKERLWLRPLSTRTARLLEDTEEAQFPFWAPDSTSIAFFTRDKLKRFDLNGIGSRTIAKAPNGRGGTWNRAGTIVYSPNLSSRLWKVSAGGGEPVPATILDPARGDVRHNFPQFLPDDRHFLFFSHSVDPKRSGPMIGTLDDPHVTHAIQGLAGNPFQAVYSPPQGGRQGQIIYVRERTLVARTFDTGSFALEGETYPILSRDSFNVASSPGFLNLTVSATGILLDGGAQRARNELVLRPRDKSGTQTVAEMNDYITPRFSLDGTRLAVTEADPVSGDYDLWIFNLQQHTSYRFTFQNGLDFYPVWTPDGGSIIYASEAAGRLSLFQKTVNGRDENKLLWKNTGANPYPYDISSDGRFLLFVQIGEGDRGDIWVLPLDQKAPAFPFLKTPAAELHPQFSSGAQSGKWIVYTSDESGIEQVYVRRFAGHAATEGKWQISSNGGKYPVWRGDGSEIIYLGADGNMMSAPVRFEGDFIQPGTPKALFEAALPSTPFSRYPYDLTHDGRQFLLLNAAQGRAPQTLSVFLNWEGLLHKGN